MAPNNFTPIAPIYDVLAKAVFGNTLHQAQVDALTHVVAGARVLVVGGGTGKILADLGSLHPSGLHITYVEQSAGMMARARKRDFKANEVEFVQLPIESVMLGQADFDVVVTPFILDCLSEPLLGGVCSKLATGLRPGGLWLHIDFTLNADSPAWQRLTMKAMYAFFHIAAGIGADALAPLDRHFEGFTLLREDAYLHAFVKMQVYRKKAAAEDAAYDGA
jgi:ubiquinone/menaquinone biosynthesis C-methylase UbiE